MFIPHPSRLLEGRFTARYDRFIAEIDLGGRAVEAHCVNPGKMEGLVKPGVRAWVSEAPPGAKRKLAYTLELIELEGRIIGANTNSPNRIASELIQAKEISGLKRYRLFEREVRYGNRSRVDIRLTIGSRHHYVEVKNCHLVYSDGIAYFPDSVSARAAGHLRELSEVSAAGDLASVLFIVQRSDAHAVRPSDLHDPAMARAAREARAAGVRFRCAVVEPTVEGFRFVGEIPVDLRPYSLEGLAEERDANRPYSGWIPRGRLRRQRSVGVGHEH
ncbi:MAG: DNA/RNA nuclease SfsA [Myxococcota bacterium]